jgi:uncharacterized membrane protein YcgQ (UPF0703/DUF1980 family)
MITVAYTQPQVLEEQTTQWKKKNNYNKAKRNKRIKYTEEQKIKDKSIKLKHNVK